MSIGGDVDDRDLRARDNHRRCRFHTGNGGFQMVSDHAWTGQLGHRLASRRRRDLAVPDPDDRGALPDRSWRSHQDKDATRDRSSSGCSCSRSACIGSFVALDLVLFFVFFELTLVPVYFVIAGWGFEKRSAAAVEVLPLHVPRLGVPARRDHGARRPARPADRQAHLRPGRALLDAPELYRPDPACSWPSRPRSR